MLEKADEDASVDLYIVKGSNEYFFRVLDGVLTATKLTSQEISAISEKLVNQGTDADGEFIKVVGIDFSTGWSVYCTE